MDNNRNNISKKVLCNLVALIVVIFAALIVIFGIRSGISENSEASTSENAMTSDSEALAAGESNSAETTTSEIISADVDAGDSSVTLVSAEDSYNGYIDVKTENVISIRLFLKDGYCYIMLPSYFSSPSVKLDFDEADFSLELDGKELLSGDEILIENTDSTDRIIGIHSDSVGIDGNYVLSIMRSENIEALYINTKNETMDYINEDKSHQEPGEYTIVGNDGNLKAEGTIKEIHARGTSSFTSTEKKSYKMNLDAEADLLGSGNSDEYVLLANSFDPTKMRNILAYDLANKLSSGSASETKSVDVYFNGNYAGNYLICEPVSETYERLNAKAEGSYLIAEDWVTDGSRSFDDKYDDQYIVKSPEDISIEESKELQKKLINIETLIESCDTEQEYEELKALVDIDSFTVAYIMDSIADDADGNRGSTYYYFSGKDGKLYAGPEWDYDRAWGNNDEGREQHVEFNVYDDGLPEKFSDISFFMNEVREKYNSEKYIDELLIKIEEVTDMIKQSVSMDSVVNSHDGLVDYGTLSLNIGYMKYFIENREELLTGILKDRSSYSCITVSQSGEESSDRGLWIKTGSTLSGEMLGNICEFYGCDHVYTVEGTTIWPGFPIVGDMTICVPEGESDTE